MSETQINIQEVINDLAEQVKRLTIDNAVLRAALAAQSPADEAQDAPAGDEEPLQ